MSESDELLDPVVESVAAVIPADAFAWDPGDAFTADWRIDWNFAAAPPPGVGEVPVASNGEVPIWVPELLQILLLHLPPRDRSSLHTVRAIHRPHALSP